MGAKEWITVAFILVISAVAMLNVTEKSEPKMLQQKITMTAQTLDTIRSNANTYKGIVPTRDYAGLSMAALSSKGIIDYTVNGGTGTITAPFDKEMTFSIAPTASTGNKKFTISIVNSLNTSMDANQKQQFEDNIKSYVEAASGTVGDYNATGAEGKITMTFSN